MSHELKERKILPGDTDAICQFICFSLTCDFDWFLLPISSKNRGAASRLALQCAVTVMLQLLSLIVPTSLLI